MVRNLIFALAAVVAVMLLPNCARDVNMEGDEDPYPLEVKLGFRTRAAMDKVTWYYMVFNFTAAPSTDITTAPIDFISDEDRGANWELYVALKGEVGGTNRLLTLQRPRVPTILQVAEGPTDTAVGDFNGDGITDVAVACRLGNVVQLIAGTETEVFNTTYFDDAISIHDAPAPFRLHAAELTEDTLPDLVLLGLGAADDEAYLRVIQNNGIAGYESLGDTAVSGIPVDAVFAELNGDNLVDAAVVTVDSPGGPGTLRIFHAVAGGGFTEADTETLGTDPSAVAFGNLDGGGLDFAVATRGATGTDGAVYFFSGEGDGTIAAAPQVLDVAGGAISVSFGRMFGDADDLVTGYTDDTGSHFLGVFHNETDEPLAGPAQTQEISVAPQYAVAHEVGGDTRTDVVVVNGVPGSGGNTLLIRRGDRENVEDSLETLFAWDDLPINYLVGEEASRIELADLDGNGVADFIMPNSGPDAQDNYTIGLFYGIGKANYTSADIYWTDLEPQSLLIQDWYVDHEVGPNSFILTIDPGLFYDLARQPPEEFIFDFMTGTTGIDLDNNPDQLGEIRDHLSAPVNVPMEIGHFNDEQNTPRANVEIAPVASEDIEFWSVEVF